METKIDSHYGSDRLCVKIRDALKTAGKDPQNLELRDLSVIDQLHTGGHNASLNLAKRAGLSPGIRLLDVGCGIGGTSRLLAKIYGCRVIAIDLVKSFIEAAGMLTTATGMDGRINFCQGDVTCLPFQKNSFNAIWCQHTLMNIKDKNSAFIQMSTILKPGGLLILHEIVKDNNSPVNFPVPWADSPGISFLEPWAAMHDSIQEKGFSLETHLDVTREASLWWHRVRAARPKIQSRPKPLGPHIIFGKNAKEFGRTMTANLDQNCINVIEAVYKKIP